MNQFMSLKMALCDELFPTAQMITHEGAISRLMIECWIYYMRPQMSLKVASLCELF